MQTNSQCCNFNETGTKYKPALQSKDNMVHLFSGNILLLLRFTFDNHSIFVTKLIMCKESFDYVVTIKSSVCLCLSLVMNLK